MSDTVVSRTFPYRPSGGFTDAEIWGGPAAQGGDTSTVIDGGTAETKARLAQIGISTVDKLADILLSKVAGKQEVPPSPREQTEAKGTPQTTPGNIPKINVTGKAVQISTVGYVAIAIVGTVLLVGLFAEARG